MTAKGPTWIWYGILGLGLILAMGLTALYAYLPADGATGDMQSLTSEGFRVQWLIENRPGGLQVGDIIVSTQGYSLEEWLEGQAGRVNWHAGDTVEYVVIRNASLMPIELRLAPLSIRSVFSHWASQSLGSMAFIILGAYVFLHRSYLVEARIFMLFFMAVGLQIWGDAYNIQYSTIPQQWPFWLQHLYEFTTFHIAVSAINYLVLIFPLRHPSLEKWPRRVPALIFLLPFTMLFVVFVGSKGMISALRNVTSTSWLIAIIQIFLTIMFGIRSAVVARDPVKRAQTRWLLFCAALETAILIPGYVIPLLLGISPPLPHALTNTIIALVPLFIVIIIFQLGLFNIQIVVIKTIEYGIVTILLTGIYLVVVRLATILVPFVLHRQEDTLVVFIATITIALLFNPLRYRIQGIIDGLFYKTKLDYHRIQTEFSHHLVTSVKPDQIRDLLTKDLPNLLQISSASLIVFDPYSHEYYGNIDAPAHETSDSIQEIVKYLRKSPKPILRLQPPRSFPKTARDYMAANQFELTIPLLMGDEIIGLYNLGGKMSNDGYNRDEITLLQLLGQQATIAIENSRLIQEKEHQSELLAGLHQAAVAVSSSLDTDELLEILISQFGKIINVSRAYICDINLETAQSTVLAEWASATAPDQTSDLGTVYNMKDYPRVYQSIRTFEPFVIKENDPNALKADFKCSKKYGINACLIIPFVVQKRLIGFMELWESRWGRIFTDEDIRICQTLAADAAAALERARLFETERKQRRLAEAIQGAAATINSALELDLVLDSIFAQVEKVIKGDTINIMLVTENIAQIIRGHGYKDKAHLNTVQQYRIHIKDFPTLRKMAATGRALVIPDTSIDPLWTHMEDWQKPQSFIGAPICLSGKTIGFLNVNGNQPHQFSMDDALWLETFANTAAAALERARLFEAERTQRKLAEALQEAASVVSSSLELDVVLDHILDQIRLVVSGDTFNIMMVENEVATFVRWQGYSEQEINHLILNFSMPVAEFGTFQEMIESGKALLISDTHQSSIWKTQPGWEWQRSYVGAPVFIHGKIAGFINVDGEQTNMFDEDDAKYLEVFAYHAATAIQNARLFERIRESLAEKEILLKEIHHRVKNNLQIITSLLSLQSYKIESQYVRSTFMESQNRVQAMALVHDKLYRSKNISKINFGEYIQDLTHYLHGAYRTQHQTVDLMIKVEHLALEIDVAIPCGLILNELISNAFKHSFPITDKLKSKQEKYFIRVELETTPSGHICLKVSNNGILAPEGLNIETPESLGLQLVRSLVNQLLGNFELNITDETIFTVTFPISKNPQEP